MKARYLKKTRLVVLTALLVAAGLLSGCENGQLLPAEEASAIESPASEAWVGGIDVDAHAAIKDIRRQLRIEAKNGDLSLEAYKKLSLRLDNISYLLWADLFETAINETDKMIKDYTSYPLVKEVPKDLVVYISRKLLKVRCLIRPEDADGDGYSCIYDCNDRDASVRPNADEICGDNVDNNCDLKIDIDCTIYI